METKQKLNAHEKNKCSFRHVKCAYCDIEDLQEPDRTQHESNECQLRPIACRFCKAPIPAKDIAVHEEMRCSERRIKCTLCQQEMRAGKLPQHEELLCSKRPIRCSNHCGATISYEELSKHKHKLCPLRRVECRKCGSCMLYKDRAAHEEACSADDIEVERTIQRNHPNQPKLVEKENFHASINTSSYSTSNTTIVSCKNVKLGCKWNELEANLVNVCALNHHTKL